MRGAWKVWDGKQWADLYNNATRPGRIALSSTPPPETVDLTATPAGARKPCSFAPHGGSVIFLSRPRTMVSQFG